MNNTYYCKIVGSDGKVHALRTKKRAFLEVWVGRHFTADPKAIILDYFVRAE